MKLRKKLFVLSGLPVAAAIALSAVVARDGYQQWQRADDFGSVERTAGLLNSSVQLLAHLQAERSLIAWHSGAKDAERDGIAAAQLQFRDVEARRATELRKSCAGRLVRIAQGSPLPLDVKHAIATTRTALSRLDSSIANRSLTERMRGYAAAIDGVVSVLAHLQQLPRDAKLANTIMLVSSLAQFSEQIGRTHATMAHAIASGTFAPGAFRALVTQSTQKRTLFDLLLSNSDPQLLAKLQAAESAPWAVRAENELAAVLNSIDEALPKDGAAWFDWQQHRLSDLTRLQEGLVAGIITQAAAMSSQAKRRLALGLSVMFSVLLLGAIAHWASHRLLRSIKVIESAAQRVLADDNYAVRAPRMSNDEVGALAESFNRMLGEIQSRDLALKEHQENLETQVKQRTQELESERDRGEAILHSAASGIVGVDEEGNINFMNDSAARILCTNGMGVLGEPIAGVMPLAGPKGGAFAESDHPVCVVARTHQSQAMDSVPCPVPGGETRSLTGVVTPLGHDDIHRGAVVVFEDVSARRALEQRLNEANKLEAIGQLAAGVAHEINTPMQFIGDNVSFLDDAFEDLHEVLDAYRETVKTHRLTLPGAHVEKLATLEDEKDMEFLAENIPDSVGNAAEGVKRVSKIVQAMKDFSHPGSDDKQMADLNAAVQSTITVSTNVWKHAARVETALAADLPRVRCHLGDINQVVLNLIVNATHAIADRGLDPSEARIKVSTLFDDHSVQIHVEDTGGGIPEDVRSRIFEPFFTTKEVGRGTGQGLALARSTIVEKHRGVLDFETKEGVGTTFMIRLPRDAATGEFAAVVNA